MRSLYKLGLQVYRRKRSRAHQVFCAVTLQSFLEVTEELSLVGTKQNLCKVGKIVTTFLPLCRITAVIEHSMKNRMPYCV